MQVALWSLVVVASLLILALYWAVVKRPAAPLAVPPVALDPPGTCAGCERLAHDVEHLETEFAAVKVAVAEGINHVDRVENRIRGAVKRARKELHDRGLESPGLEAEATGLSLVDGDGGEGAPVLGVQPSVEEAPSSVPGVSREQLRKVRGV